MCGNNFSPKFLIFGILILSNVFCVSNAEVTLTPSTQNISENSIVTLTCSYSGILTLATYAMTVSSPSSPPASVGSLLADCKVFTVTPISSLYEYSCPTNKQLNWTIKNVTRANEGDTWRCTVGFTTTGSENAIFTINVKVPIQSVTMTSPTGSIVTVNENTETVIVCTTSGGLPAATVRWYKELGTTNDHVAIINGSTISTRTSGYLIFVTSTLRYSPTKEEYGMRIYCSATNSDAVFTSNRKPKLNVQYAPDSFPNIHGYGNGSLLDIIEGNESTLSCTITGGNPLATLTWNCYNAGSNTVIEGLTVTKSVSWTASRDTDRSCTCQSTHPAAENQTVSVNVQVLYPPKSPIFKVQNTSVSGPISFIEDNARSVVCESKGNPDPDTYVWAKEGITDINGTTLTFNNVQKQDNGDYVCTAQNTMISSSGIQQRGINSSTVEITVLFLPSVPLFYFGNSTGAEITNNSVDVLRGDSFTSVCKSDGNPQPNYQWSGQAPDTQILTVSSIQADQSRTCTATNTMKDTSGVTQEGSASSTLTINVRDIVTVTSFAVGGFEGSASVTVSENDNIPFTCTVDIYSNSTIELMFRGKTLYRRDNTETLTYIQSNAACFDAGVYTCAASNKYNYWIMSLKKLTIYVRCSPRPLHQIKKNFTSSLFFPMTLSFTALAYPEPGRNGFVWQKENGYTWIPLLSNADILVWSSELQTNLTIKNVSESDYGHYRVTVTNEIGKYDQYMFLTVKDSHTGNNCNETLQQTSARSMLILGVTLGLLCAIFVSYATIVTIMLKRRMRIPELLSSPEVTEPKNTTYINLGLIPESGNMQSASSGNNGNNEDDVNQYTALERTNSDQKTYDIIERVQN